VPRVLITDKLAELWGRQAEVLPRLEHRQSRSLTNRAATSHHSTRKREQMLQRFTAAGHAHRFLSALVRIRQHCCPQRHRLRAVDYRAERQQ
jgi:putative transposase